MRRAPPTGYGSHRAESFSRFYLRNVAVSEGCGCAERVILRRDEPRPTGSLRAIWAALRYRLAVLRAR